jgi:cytochrome P450 family 110
MKLPAGPETPRLIQNFNFVTDPIGYMEANAERYGDIFTTKAFAFHSHPSLMVSNPEALKQILTNDTKDLAAPSELGEIVVPWLGDYSLLFLEGETHRRQRQLVMPPFHGERMRSYAQAICDITETVMAQQIFGKPFLARTLMRDVSLQVMMKVVLGFYEGERWEKFRQLMLALMEHFQNPLMLATGFFPFFQKDLGMLTPWGRFLYLRGEMDKLLYDEINERRDNPDPERTDVLSLLMLAHDQDGQGMTNKELRDQVITLLFVGFENTSTAIAWSLYWVHKEPKVREKLLQELDSLGESPDPMTIARLPYLTAVCNETLRMSSVNMMISGRVVRSPIELMGYKLTPGTALFGSIYLTHRREDLYPQPKQFRPERFLEQEFSPYEFVPFGGGIRSCIGASLAQFEMKLVLATVLSRYQLALKDRQPEQLQGRGIVLVPARGVKMAIESKRVRQEQQLTATVS